MYTNQPFVPVPTLVDIANPELTQTLQHKLNNKTKPLGSLGRIEELALKLGQIRLAGLDIAQCTGAGTGLDAPAVLRKTAILVVMAIAVATASEPAYSTGGGRAGHGAWRVADRGIP